jgi:hypothetical protein
MNNLNLTQEDAQHIINVVWRRREGMINGDRVSEVIKYVNMITGKELSLPGCSCEYRAMWGLCYDIISQNLTEIERIANGIVEEPETIIITKTRGRKKK